MVTVTQTAKNRYVESKRFTFSLSRRSSLVQQYFMNSPNHRLIYAFNLRFSLPLSLLFLFLSRLFLFLFLFFIAVN